MTDDSEDQIMVDEETRGSLREVVRAVIQELQSADKSQGDQAASK